MKQNFNELTPAQDERLALLAEECAEVIQAICKIQRHGFDSTNPNETNGETNREALIREIGDVTSCVDRLVLRGDIVYSPHADLGARAAAKDKYLHHQEGF